MRYRIPAPVRIPRRPVDSSLPIPYDEQQIHHCLGRSTLVVTGRETPKIPLLGNHLCFEPHRRSILRFIVFTLAPHDFFRTGRLEFAPVLDRFRTSEYCRCCRCCCRRCCRRRRCCIGYHDPHRPSHPHEFRTLPVLLPQYIQLVTRDGERRIGTDQ